MTGGVARRTIALGGVALLAALVSLALSAPRRHGKSNLPKPVPTWYRALAAPYRPPPTRRKTACGVRLDASTVGVAHPVLPCGVKIYIAYNGKQILTQVVDRGVVAPGREFEVTQALAERIGLRGTEPVRWTYAR